MFETLVESNVARRPRARPALAALLLHLGAVAGAISATANARNSLGPVARDTIRLELAHALLPERRHSGPVAPRAARPEIPLAPPAPEVPPIVPGVEPPRLRLTRIDLAALGLNATGPTSSESTAVSAPVGPVLSVSEVDELPELQGELRPHYPAALQQAGVSGVVELEYVISDAGRVDSKSVRVLGSTHPAFSAAAGEAVGRARFRPARRDGRPVAVLVRQTIRFVSQ
jgi:periplasmic protein TonB